MAKPSNRELFAAILSSNILAPYLQQNEELAELIKSPDHPDVHYFADPAPARELAPALKRRLSGMAAKGISHNLEASRQLVAFMEQHPEGQIYNVTFNCQAQHYGVRCGLVDSQLHVICVMTGGHIPDEFLGASIP